MIVTSVLQVYYFYVLIMYIITWNSTDINKYGFKKHIFNIVQ